MRLDLKTRLDERIESQFLAYRKVGRYHNAQIVAGAIGTNSFGANLLYATPFHLPEDMSFDKIATSISTQAVGNARMGIYRDNRFVYPGVLILDSGPIDTNVLGDAVVNINVTLSAGLYYLAWLANSNPTILNFVQEYIPSIIGANSPGETPGPIFQIALAYDALPNPFPAGSGYYWSFSPGICLRRSS